MLLTTTKDNLVFAINAALKAINPKSILPFYSCLKIETFQGQAIITGASLEMSVSCSIPVQVEKEGAILVPAKHFGEIIRRLPDTIIELSVTTGEELEIRYENSFFSLKTMSADSFPPLPTFGAGLDFSIEADTMKRMIKQTGFAASVDEIKAVFTGLFWEVEGDSLNIVSTDTHRMALAKGAIENKETQSKGQFIIPAKTAGEIARLLQDSPCRVQVEKNLVFFSFEQIKIHCRMLEGQFPNYRLVIPSQFSTELVFDVKAFYHCVERISLFALEGESTSSINMDVRENGEVVIHSRSAIGAGRETIFGEMQGATLQIAFNARYLADVFKVTEGESMEMKLSGALTAGIMRVPGEEGFLYLVLPMRV